MAATYPVIAVNIFVNTPVSVNQQYMITWSMFQQGVQISELWNVYKLILNVLQQKWVDNYKVFSVFIILCRITSILYLLFCTQHPLWIQNWKDNVLFETIFEIQI